MASSIGENAQPTSTNDNILDDVLREEANTQSVHTNDSAIDYSIRAEKTETKSTTKHNADSMPPPLLPPCRVCEEKASGFHYGVNTCEACKGFFRRSLQRHKPYRCKMNEKCQIEGTNLSAKCPKCRLEKCLEVGMSKEGIQMGRYNLEKRADYIMEVKGLKSIDDDQNTNMNHEKCDDDMNVYLSDMSTQSSVKTLEEIMSPVSDLLAVYHQITYDTPEFLENKAEKERKYLEKCCIEEELFGKMQSLSLEEYVAIKNETGLDVDGTAAFLASQNNLAENHYARQIKFLQNLPNFSDFCLEDQVAISKYALKLSILDLLSPNQYNYEKGLYHSPTGEVQPLEKFEKMYKVDVINDYNKLFKRFIDFNLQTEEIILFVAVFILLTDELEIKEPEKVESSLNICLECLLHLLEKNHLKDQFVFPKLVSFMTDYRVYMLQFDINHVLEMEQIFGIKFHRLVHEIMA